MILLAIPLGMFFGFSLYYVLRRRNKTFQNN